MRIEGSVRGKLLLLGSLHAGGLKMKKRKKKGVVAFI